MFRTCKGVVYESVAAAVEIEAESVLVGERSVVESAASEDKAVEVLVSYEEGERDGVCRAAERAAVVGSLVVLGGRDVEMGCSAEVEAVVRECESKIVEVVAI